MATQHDILARFDADTSGFSAGTQDVSSQINKLGSAFTTLGTGALAGVGVAAVGVGAALAGVGMSAFSVASEIQTASLNISDSLNVTSQQANQLGEDVGAIWVEFGGEIGEVNEALITTGQKMDAINPSQIKEATSNAIKLGDSFAEVGGEVEWTTQTANFLIDTFGTDMTTAFDTVAYSLQNMNQSGDAMEGWLEYAPALKAAGFELENITSLMETGEMDGVFGTDKVLDMGMEATRLFNEGGEAYSEALAKIGFSYNEMTSTVASGEATFADYFQEMLNGINNVESPIERHNMMLALLGDAAGDLGPDAIKGWDIYATGLEDIKGSMDSVGAKYDSIAEVSERFGRRAQMAIKPIGDELLNLANEAVPHLEAGFDWFEAELPGIIQIGKDAVTTFRMALAGDWQDNANKIMPIHRAFGLVGQGVAQAAEFVMIHGETIKGALMGIGVVIAGAGIVTGIAAMGAAVASLMNPITLIVGGAAVLGAAWVNNWGGIQEKTTAVWEAIKPVLNTVGEAITLIGTGDLEGLANLWVEAAPQIEGFATRFYEWVDSTKEELRTRFDAWSLAATEWIMTVGPDLLAQAEEVGTSFMQWVGAKANDVTISFDAWSLAATEWIMTVGPDLLASAEEVGASFMQWVGTQANDVAIGFMDWGEAFIEWVGPAAIGFLAEWPLVLYDFLTWIEESAGPILLQLGDWSLSFIEWIYPMLPELWLASAAISGALFTFIAETAVVLGVKLIEWGIAFVAWVGLEAIPRLVVALGKVVIELGSWIGSTAGWLLTEGATLGTSLLDGILSMLNNAGGVIGQAIEDSIWAAIGSVKSTFRIQSPSKVIAQLVGIPLAQGILVGFQSVNIKRGLFVPVEDAFAEISQMVIAGAAENAGAAYQVLLEHELSQSAVNAVGAGHQVLLEHELSQAAIAGAAGAAVNAGAAYQVLLEHELSQAAVGTAGLSQVTPSLAAGDLNDTLAESDFAVEGLNESISELGITLSELFTTSDVVLQELGESVSDLKVELISFVEWVREQPNPFEHWQVPTVPTTTTSTTASPVPAAATGTSYASGGRTLLAEGGPELVTSPGIRNLQRGSRVYDANETRRLLSGPASQQPITITINVTAAAGREQLAAQAMRSELDNALMRARARGYA